jgi:hypothetical protein
MDFSPGGTTVQTQSLEELLKTHCVLMEYKEGKRKWIPAIANLVSSQESSKTPIWEKIRHYVESDGRRIWEVCKHCAENDHWYLLVPMINFQPFLSALKKRLDPGIPSLSTRITPTVAQEPEPASPLPATRKRVTARSKVSRATDSTPFLSKETFSQWDAEPSQPSHPHILPSPANGGHLTNEEILDMFNFKEIPKEIAQTLWLKTNSQLPPDLR